jgi:hypothetical protein
MESISDNIVGGSSSGDALAPPFDPHAFMEEMKRQNEAILESHKKQIEAQYNEQMSSFLQSFSPPIASKGSSLAAKMKLKRPIVTDIEFDEETSRFNENASQTRPGRPQFEQYEGDNKTHIIRAQTEGNSSNTHVVHTSGNNDMNSGYQQQQLQTAPIVKPKKKKEVVHHSLLKNPLGDQVAPASWQATMNKKKATQKQLQQQQQQHFDDADHEDEEDDLQNSATLQSKEKYLHNDSIKQFDDATQFMLKKTAFLLEDAKSLTTGKKKLKQKKKQSKQYNTTQYVINDDDYIEDDNYNDGIEEEEGANGRDGSALGTMRLPHVKNIDASNLSETAITEKNEAQSRNILVKSVEFDSTSPLELPDIEKKNSSSFMQQKQSIHPDYQWTEEQRVNNHEYKIDPHLALHKSEWENEIARHIISVYATSKSGKDVKEAKTILKYVDINREESHKGVENYVRSEDGRSDNENQQEIEDELERSTDTSHHPAAQPGTKTATEAGMDFTRVEKSFRNHSKYRSCLVVTVGRTGKTAGAPHNPGTEISIRGSPRCFPIWFVTSGEIYSNWSKLHGGDMLQAQLLNLYENRRFKEYLGILEKIIDDMWRDRKLGKVEGVEDFLNRRHSTRKRVQLDDKVRLVGKDGKIMEKLKDHKHKAPPKVEEKPKHQTGEGAWADDAADGNIWDKIASDEKVEEAKRAELSDDELISLWGQLILTANAFGILCIEKKNYDLALEILQKAEIWCKRGDFLPKEIRLEILPHVLDALAFYFYKRGKNMSSMTYTNLALKEHEELGNLDNICICLLHVAAIQSQGGHFKEAHKTLYQVLAMVEDGRLAFENASPKQLCLVAISYHNLAVVQLKMMVPDLASKSSQNARKIARLCLSYSNRWLHIFQWTHEVAMEDIKYQLTLKPKIPLNDKQLHVIRNLTEDMYDPDAG